MDNIKICVLCYNSLKNQQPINLFSNESASLNIVEILKKHFWFKVFRIGNAICMDCWGKTEYFNKFYTNIELLHNKSFNLQTTFVNVKNNHNQDCKLMHYDIKKEEDLNGDSMIRQIEAITVEPVVVMVDNIEIGSENDIFDGTDLKKKHKHKHSKKGKTKTKLVKNVSAKYVKIPVKNISKKQNLPSTNSLVNKTIAINKNDIKEEDEFEHTLTEDDSMMMMMMIKNENDTKDSIINLNDIKRKLKLRIEIEDNQIRDYFQMQCDFCECKFQTFLGAKEHYRTKHKIPGYLRCCKRKFKRRGLVMEHITRHLNPDVYKCSICQKNYATKVALQSHIQSNHEPDQVKPYECEICSKSFLKKFDLNRHTKYSHISGNSIFSCDICRKCFASKYSLSAHIRGIHENANTQICDVCAKVFKNKAILQRHLESHFGSDSTPYIQCNICGAWLKYKSSLHIHMAKHTDIQQTCPKCGKISANRDSLRHHMHYVHSERTHLCTLCGKSFKKPIELKEHTASHTGESLYSCPYCPKTFNSGSNMRSHRKKAHPIEWQSDKLKPNSII